MVSSDVGLGRMVFGVWCLVFCSVACTTGGNTRIGTRTRTLTRTRTHIDDERLDRVFERRGVVEKAFGDGVPEG